VGRKKGKFTKLFTPDKEEFRLLRKYKMMDRLEDVPPAQIERIIARLKRQEKGELKAEYPAVMDLAKAYARARSRYQNLITSPGTSPGDIARAKKKFDEAENALALYAEIRNLKPKLLQEIVWHTKKKELPARSRASTALANPLTHVTEKTSDKKFRAAISRNIATEMEAGKPQKQAVAIALSQARRDAPKKTTKIYGPKPNPEKTKKKSRKSNPSADQSVSGPHMGHPGHLGQINHIVRILSDGLGNNVGASARKEFVRKAQTYTQTPADWGVVFTACMSYILVESKYSALSTAKKSGYSKKKDVEKVIVKVARLISKNEIREKVRLTGNNAYSVAHDAYGRHSYDAAIAATSAAKAASAYSSGYGEDAAEAVGSAEEAVVQAVLEKLSNKTEESVEKTYRRVGAKVYADYAAGFLKIMRKEADRYSRSGPRPLPKNNPAAAKEKSRIKPELYTESFKKFIKALSGVGISTTILGADKETAGFDLRTGRSIPDILVFADASLYAGEEVKNSRDFDSFILLNTMNKVPEFESLWRISRSEGKSGSYSFTVSPRKKPQLFAVNPSSRFSRRKKKNPEPTLVTKGKIGIAKFKGRGKGLAKKDLAELEKIKGNLEIHYELASLYTGARAKTERSRIKVALRDVNDLIKGARRKANPGSSSRITEGRVRKILGKIGIGVRDIVDHPDTAKRLGIESVMEIYTDDRPWDRHSTGHLETPLTVWQRSNGTFDYIYGREARLQDQLKRDYVTSWSCYYASLKDVLHVAIANSERGKFQGEMAWRKANPSGDWEDRVRRDLTKHWGQGNVGRVGPSSERWKVFVREVPVEDLRQPGTDIVIGPRGEAISKPRAQLLASKGVQRIPTERGWIGFDQFTPDYGPKGGVYAEIFEKGTKRRRVKSKKPSKEMLLGEYMHRGIARRGGARPEVEEFVKGRKKDIFASMRKHAQSEVYDNPGVKNSWLKPDGKNDVRIHKAINKIGRMSKSEAALYIPKIEKSLQKNIKKMQSGDIHDSMSQEWNDAMFDILFDEFRRSLAKRRAGKKLSRHEAEDIKGIPDAIPAKSNPQDNPASLRKRRIAMLVMNIKGKHSHRVNVGSAYLLWMLNDARRPASWAELEKQYHKIRKIDGSDMGWYSVVDASRFVDGFLDKATDAHGVETVSLNWKGKAFVNDAYGAVAAVSGEKTKSPKKSSKEALLGEYMQRGLRGGGPRKETEEFVKGRQKDIFASMRKHAQSQVYDNPTGRKSTSNIKDGMAKVRTGTNFNGWKLVKKDPVTLKTKPYFSDEEHVLVVVDPISGEGDARIYAIYDERGNFSGERAIRYKSEWPKELNSATKWANSTLGLSSSVRSNPKTKKKAKANPRVGSDLLRFSNRVRYEGSGPGPEGLGLKRNDLVEMEISRGWGTGSFKRFGRVTDVISVPNSSFGKTITGYEISQWDHGEYEGYRNPLSLVWERVGPWYGSGPGSYRKIKWRLKVRDDLYKNRIKDIFEINEVKRVGRVESDASGAPIQRTIALDPRHREYIEYTETYAKAKSQKKNPLGRGNVSSGPSIDLKDYRISAHNMSDRVISATFNKLKSSRDPVDRQKANILGTEMGVRDSVSRHRNPEDNPYKPTAEQVDRANAMDERVLRRVHKDILGSLRGSSRWRSLQYWADNSQDDLKAIQLAIIPLIAAGILEVRDSKQGPQVRRIKTSDRSAPYGGDLILENPNGPNLDSNWNLAHLLLLQRLVIKKGKADERLTKKSKKALNDLHRLGLVEVISISGPYQDPEAGPEEGELLMWDASIRLTPEGREYVKSHKIMEMAEAMSARAIAGMRGRKKKAKKNPRRTSPSVASVEKAMRKVLVGRFTAKALKDDKGDVLIDPGVMLNNTVLDSIPIKYWDKIVLEKAPKRDLDDIFVIFIFSIQPDGSVKTLRVFPDGEWDKSDRYFHKATHRKVKLKSGHYISYDKSGGRLAWLPTRVSQLEKVKKELADPRGRLEALMNWGPPSSKYAGREIETTRGILVTDSGAERDQDRRQRYGPAGGTRLNPKKGSAKKKPSKKKPISDALKKSSAPWKWDANDLSFGGRIIAQEGDLSVLLRQWREDRWDKGWTVHAIKDGVTLEDREEEFDIRTAIKRGEKHFKKAKKKEGPLVTQDEFDMTEAYSRMKKSGGTLEEHMSTVQSERTSRRKKIKKKSVRKSKPGWKILTDRCDKLWDDYDKKSTKKNLNLVFDHLAKMKASTKYETSKNVRDKRASCLRKANKEAKRLKIKNPGDVIDLGKRRREKERAAKTRTIPMISDGTPNIPKYEYVARRTFYETSTALESDIEPTKAQLKKLLYNVHILKEDDHVVPSNRMPFRVMGIDFINVKGGRLHLEDEIQRRMD